MTQVRRISDALKVRAKHQCDEIAHDGINRQITYAEWDREADEIGGGLAAAGLQPGDRVFLPISNAHAVEMAIAVFAVFRAGGIACPINTRLNAKEIADFAELTTPRWCITDVSDIVAGLDLAGCWTVADMPRDLTSLPDQAALDPQADAEILGTSGTTGKIKGVVVSHPDLMKGVTGTNMDRSRSTLSALPLTGSGGNLGIVMLPVRGGATAITQPKFDPKGFLDLVREKRPNLVYLVPTMLRLILDQPNVADYDFKGVRYLMTGTAPLPHDSVKRALDLWPHVRMRNSYGMSEGGIGVSTTSVEQVLKPGCVGKLPEHMQLRDEHGKIVTQPGVVGEIYGYQKHPRRYWNDPEATAASFVGGWTKTGDLGYVDEDGDLIMAGRSKELIIRGGYNITPLEIETALHLHPAVQQAAVVGVDHDVLGEDIAAAVTLRPGQTADEAEIIQFCRLHLADNKVPRTLVILDIMPLNPNGKILKKELVEPLTAAARARRKAA
ncbi:acyl-CoA synthetase (AMP-forming)/AMP-acid ligase II [Erythromicrobium ramosum]|uniref:Acyl-CoA synthetase (AMP-forming)/AMP-acid ligase II n=1 Tax=Erythrobacter ramosus TaxID=35811 RepID=A0ABR6I231_9SPHN|nr:class I adenylate-forming enzyme family protein [Erythrobacter ramosus]MBB3776969.1 acyl-CoA synthetase (AMP-forming)/AMP-acid ligase II [Erythrobacter ramosus]